jgi:hypothetical protein
MSSSDTPKTTQRPIEAGGLYYTDDMIKAVATTSVEAAERRPKQIGSLTEQTLEAKAALIEAVKGIGAVVEGFEPVKKDFLASILSFRMTAVAEIGKARQELELVRKFMIGPDHTKEIAALKEFVELCERLQKLKESGFLDAMAETMLRLAEPH